MVPSRIELFTIQEPGHTVDGYVLVGASADDLVGIAAAILDFNDDEATAETVRAGTAAIVATMARLECWECGCSNGRKVCCQDDEGKVWNFRAGKPASVVMRDGRSVFDHFPQHSVDQAAA